VTPHYVRVQLFFPQAGEYSERASASRYVRTGAWQVVEFPLPADGILKGQQRLDPADARGIIEIAELQVLPPGSPDPIWFATDWSSEITVSGSAIRLRSEAPLTLLSYGNDPVLILPEIKSIPAGSVMRVKMRARIGEAVFSAFARSVVEGYLRTVSSGVAPEAVTVALTVPEEAVGMLESLQSEREELRAERREAASLRKEVDRAVCDLAASRAENAQLREALTRAEGERDEERASRRSVLASWSWRITAPLRIVGSMYVRLFPRGRFPG
jgi:hypothetical protein